MNKYKAELTIPAEQYGNIRPTVEGTPEEIVGAYFEFKKLLTPREGLLPKQFNACLDEYLKTGTLRDGVNLYGEMSFEQQNVFQQIKKSLKRIKANGGNDEE